MTFRKEILAEGVEVYLGDCLEVLPTLAGRYDAVVTDPPYGIGWRRGRNRARNSKPHSGIKNDNDTSARDAMLGMVGKTPTIAFGSFYAKYPPNIKQILVWHKPADAGLVGSVTGFRRDAEPIFLIGKWPVRTVEQSSVLRTIEGQAGTVSATGHPHTKPLELMKQLVRCAPGSSVLDPFCGSGSTGVACVKLGRSFVGIELDEDYFDIACRRISAALKQPDLFVSAPKPPEQLSILDSDTAYQNAVKAGAFDGMHKPKDAA